jgi:UDP-2-acetamido-2-deoxy-ribo-hexuluronate aminotransferase
MDASLLANAITPKTKAIMPVHLYGQPADIERITHLACENGLNVIEDNAQSFGATFKGKKAGSFGRVSTTSFFPAKNLGAFGDAGGIFTDDESLYWKMKMISQHGSKIRYTHEYLGLNSRLDTLQAAVLKVKLKYLDEFNAARQTAAALYDKHLMDADVVTPYRDPNAAHIYHQYTIRVKDLKQRDGLQKFLLSQDIPSSVHYPTALNLQKAFLDGKYPKGSLPIAESAGERVLSLPMHTELDEDQIATISQTIIDFVGRK